MCPLPSQNELISLPLPMGNSSDICVMVTNAEKAGWKPLCERMKNLTPKDMASVLKQPTVTNQQGIRDPLPHALNVSGCCALFHQTVKSRQPGS